MMLVFPEVQYRRLVVIAPGGLQSPVSLYNVKEAYELTTPHRKLSVSNTARDLEKANPTVKAVLQRTRVKINDLRLTRSPRGESVKIPMA